MKIKNMFFFRNLDFTDIFWELQGDGKSILTGIIHRTDIKPQESREFEIPLDEGTLQPGVEYFLNISVRTNQETGLLQKGFEIAKEQITLPFERRTEPVFTDKLLTLKVDKNDTVVAVSGTHFTITFNRVKGSMESYHYNGEPIIRDGPLPNFWRAPTDNDFGNGMDKRCALWKNAGDGNDTVKLSAKQVVKDEVVISVEKELDALHATLTNIYRIFGNGDVEVTEILAPRPKKERQRDYYKAFNGNTALYFSKEEPIMPELPPIQEESLDSFTMQLRFYA